MLLNKFLMGLQIIGTDTQNLGIELFKVFDLLLKSLQLAPSDRGEVGVIEGENHWPLLDDFA